MLDINEDVAEITRAQHAANGGDKSEAAINLTGLGLRSKLCGRISCRGFAMKLSLLPLFASAIVLSGCAAMYGSKESRVADNRAKSDYELCKSFYVAVLAPDEIRGEWVTELKRRNQNCNEYAGALESTRRANDALVSGGAAMLSRPSAVGQTGTSCYAKREWVSGFNKNCVYDCLGSDTVITIASTSLCPNTISR